MAEAQGQPQKQSSLSVSNKNNDFVLEKSIFSNVFEKDIQRVYIYKKAERLAKAIHVVSPALANSPALKGRADTIAIALVDAAILPPTSAREALSRELLALSSILGIARAGGILSSMNAELIAREAQLFLQEIAAYEAPRVLLEELPKLSLIAAKASRTEAPRAKINPKISKGHIKDNKGQSERNGGRREAIVEAIRARGSAYTRDIARAVPGVSEKTVQRELALLIKEGSVAKKGERRWTLYSLA